MHLKRVAQAGAVRHVHAQGQKVGKVVGMQVADDHHIKIHRVNLAQQTVERAGAHIEYRRGVAGAHQI